MIQSIYNEYKELGLKVIPIEWDIANKTPVSHRKWSEDGELALYSYHNAIMIKTDGIYKCLDFDIKNTSDKNLYFKWFNLVSNEMPDIINKVYIEKTRNNGYHVWFKYDKNLSKQSLAESEKGNEVIALYAGNPLVYTFPTPGYEIESGSMTDCETLNDSEFNYLISASQFFNEYKPAYNPNNKAVSYPKGYENICTIFDTEISDDNFERILNDIDLFYMSNFVKSKKDKFFPYKRKGSEDNSISAKVYFKTKRLMIFSASMPSYPNWHNKHEYSVWSLPPSFILFYKNGRDWNKTIEQITMICNAQGIELPKIESNIGQYPMDIFPDNIAKSIMEVAKARSLAPEFLATNGLWAVSSLAGTHYYSEFNGDSKNILFCLMVAPMSVGKTPAYKAMVDTPLKMIMEANDKIHRAKVESYNQAKAESIKSKEIFNEKKPRQYIPFSKDGTTEGFIGLLLDQPNGIGVYYDEAETIFNAGSFKQTNDSITFFTSAFSGGRFTQIRADRDKERVVPNMNINLMMGTQTSRLQNIFTADRLSSGFASRFLMVESDYIELNTEINPFDKSKEMCNEWVELLSQLYQSGDDYNNGLIDPIKITLDDQAKKVYTEYYRQNLRDANQRIMSEAEQYIIGTEAKMVAYFPRFCQIIAIIHSPFAPHIDAEIVHKAFRLYKWYASQTINIISRLSEEIATGLPAELELLYKSLPDSFTHEQAVETCIKLNLKDRRFDSAMRRKDFKTLFRKVKQGIYEKL